jgi:hypothetical protein
MKRKLKIVFTGDEISENNTYFNEKKMIVTIISKEEELNNQIKIFIDKLITGY